MPNKLLFSFLFFLLKVNLVLANTGIDPYCNNVIDQSKLYQIDNKPPKAIEVEIHNYKKWQKNNFKIIFDSIKGGYYGSISEKLKKSFKGTIHVKFDDEIKCSFRAKIRQHGDFADHIKLIDGKIFQSLDVELKTGHINGIVRFKLYRPETRRDPDEEIILTELLRELNFLSPRTNFVNVRLNDLNVKMLMQEKSEKELLEYHHRREGPILEGDERYMFMGVGELGDNANSTLLSRQINSRWSTKSIQHENISHEALTKLNRFYLLNRQGYGYGNVDVNYYTSWRYLDNNLLAPNNPEQVLKLDMYNAILFSVYALHGLIPHNRQFYWDATNNYFEPIYYDGFLNISSGHFVPAELPNKYHFLIGIKEAKKKIKQIKIESFFQQIKFRGSSLSRKEVEKKMEQIISNLNNLEISINKKKETENNNLFIDDKILLDYIDSTLKIKEIRSNFFLVFRDLKTKTYKVCKTTTLNCKRINLTNNEIKDLLRGRLTINKNIYQYIGEYFSLNDNLLPNKINKTRLSKYNKIKFQDTEFYFDENIAFKHDKNKSIFNIYQKYSGARAYFWGGNLKNISIIFSGIPETMNTTLNNYPFDQKNLTGCLSFIDLNLQNVSIKSLNSNCEDSVNLIRTTGHIKRFDSKNSAKDALDIDFSNIKIDEVSINSANNDCMDLSGGNYELHELNLSKCGDKALSVGEKSFVKLENFNVSKSTIGLSSKDSSITSIKNAKIQNTELCIEAKRKKQEFSGGIINLGRYNCYGSPVNIYSGSFINYHK